MIWVLVVILLIVVIVSTSKSSTKKKLEIEKLNRELSREPESKGSVSDELIKLKKLLDDGIITQDEFEKQKTKLLI